MFFPVSIIAAFALSQGFQAWAASLPEARLPNFSREIAIASARLQQVQESLAKTEAEANEAVSRARQEASAAQAAIADIDARMAEALAGKRTDEAKALAEERKLQELRMETAESEGKLHAKRIELAEEKAELWKRRQETLRMAEHLDLQAFAATADDAARNLRVISDLRKETENQAARLRRCVSRRRMGLARMKFQRNMAANRATGGSDIAGRAIQVQADWVNLYRAEEKQAIMRMAFIRTELLVRRTLAELIQKKDQAAEIEKLKARTLEAASSLDRVRTELSPRADEIDSLLEEMRRREEEWATHPDTSVQAGDKALFDVEKARLEAEKEFIREMISLAKAAAAFAAEQEERRKAAASLVSGEDIRSQRRILEESGRTSADYILSFNAVLARIENRLNALGLDTNLLHELEKEISGLVPAGAGSPDLRASLSELASRCSEKNPQTDEHRIAAAVFRIAQREATRRRLEMAEQWLDMTRRDIAALDTLAASALWTTRDLRFTTLAAHETRDFLGAAWGDLAYSWDALRMGLSDHGRSARRRILAAAFAVLILVAGIRCLAPLLDRKTGGRFDAAIAAMHPAVPFVVAAFASKIALPERMAGWTAAAVLLACAARFVADAAAALLFGDPEKRTSSSFAAAFRSLCRWNFAAAALAACAWAASMRWHNAWQIQPIISGLFLLSAAVSVARFLVHPALLGRALWRCSPNAPARLAGAATALILVIIAAVAAASWIFGYIALAGRTVLTAVLAIAMFAAAFLATRPARRVLVRAGVGETWAGTWTWLIKAALAAAAACIAFRAGRGLVRDVFLAPNAPWTLTVAAGAASSMYAAWLRFWHAELAGGMTVGSLAYGILVFAASFWVAALARRLFVERVLSKTPMDESTRATFSSIAGYIIIIIGFITGLNIAGSSLSNLALLAGAVTVGIGFGLQNVINNFVSSLLIHFSRSIRIGDYIEVGGTRGTVQEIGLRNTMVRNDDGVTVLIPNGSFVTANIINWTSPQRRIRLHVPVSIPRSADLAAISDILIQTARKHPSIVSNPPPTVELRSVAGDRLNLELLAWTDKPPAMAATVGELNLAVDEVLQQAIPKPPNGH